MVLHRCSKQEVLENPNYLLLTLMSGKPHLDTGHHEDTIMSTGKTEIASRNGANETTGEIANWLDTVSKRDDAKVGAFRKTLGSLLGG